MQNMKQKYSPVLGNIYGSWIMFCFAFLEVTNLRVLSKFLYKYSANKTEVWSSQVIANLTASLSVCIYIFLNTVKLKVEPRA